MELFLFSSLLFRGRGHYLQQFLLAVPTKCQTGNLANPAYSSVTGASKTWHQDRSERISKGDKAEFENNVMHWSKQIARCVFSCSAILTVYSLFSAFPFAPKILTQKTPTKLAETTEMAGLDAGLHLFYLLSFGVR